MALFNFDSTQIEIFLYVFFRVGAIILLMPILGSSMIPARLRAGLVLILSLVIYPIVKHQPMPEIRGLFELTIYLFSELIIGLAIAFVVRLVFSVVQIAGTVVDFQMGFGVVNVIDPQTRSQVSITAQFQNILAILIFLISDVHHFIIQAIAESFFTINPVNFHFSQLSMEILMSLFAATFVVAAKIAAPLMAILLFISVGLGLVARTVPQMNVFIIGFPLQIGVGLLMIGLSMGFFSMMVQREFMEIPHRVMGIMQSF